MAGLAASAVLSSFIRSFLPVLSMFFPWRPLLSGPSLRRRHAAFYFPPGTVKQECFNCRQDASQDGRKRRNDPRQSFGPRIRSDCRFRRLLARTGPDSGWISLASIMFKLRFFWFNTFHSLLFPFLRYFTFCDFAWNFACENGKKIEFELFLFPFFFFFFALVHTYSERHK